MSSATLLSLVTAVAVPFEVGGCSVCLSFACKGIWVRDKPLLAGSPGAEPGLRAGCKGYACLGAWAGELLGADTWCGAGLWGAWLCPGEKLTCIGLLLTGPLRCCMPTRCLRCTVSEKSSICVVLWPGFPAAAEVLCTRHEQDEL